MATRIRKVSDEVLKAAHALAKANVRAERSIKEILLAPSDDRVLLVEVDPTAIPNGDSGAVALYFRPAPAEGIPLPSGIVMITPEERTAKIPLPKDWGDWKNLIRIWPK